MSLVSCLLSDNKEQAGNQTLSSLCLSHVYDLISLPLQTPVLLQRPLTKKEKEQSIINGPDRAPLLVLIFIFTVLAHALPKALGQQCPVVSVGAAHDEVLQLILCVKR